MKKIEKSFFEFLILKIWYPTLESDLQLAIKAKDENLIQQLIDSKLDINHKDNNKLTALHDAVRKIFEKFFFPIFRPLL